MTCIPAPACQAALNEATTRWPGRLRASDGICASPQHTAQNPTSDHETGDAVDVTHDPTHGVDCNRLVAGLVARRDPRVKYLIWNRRIWRSYDKPGLPAWTPQAYTGANPHDKHMHISIKTEARKDVRPWFQTQPLEEDDLTPDQDKLLKQAVTYAKAAAADAAEAKAIAAKALEAVTRPLAPLTQRGYTDNEARPRAAWARAGKKD